MCDSYVIPVPGNFRPGVAYLDLETVKRPTDGFVMKNGEPLRNRWSAFMAGVGAYGEIRIIERTGNAEAPFLAAVREAIGPAGTVVYGATREFDEMILKGRFTNARRAHEAEAFFPAMPGADWDLTWENAGTGKVDARAADVASRDVSATYYGRGRDRDTGIVLIHNLRDVAELVYQFGDPDAECAAWLLNVLTDDEFAFAVLYGETS